MNKIEMLKRLLLTTFCDEKGTSLAWEDFVVSEAAKLKGEFRHSVISEFQNQDALATLR